MKPTIKQMEWWLKRAEVGSCSFTHEKQVKDAIRTLIIAVGEWQKRAGEIMDAGYDDYHSDFIKAIADFGKERE